MNNPFDDLTYFVVDYTSIPSGWSNQEKRDSRKRVNRGVGQQNNAQTHMNTWHRKDKLTLYDEDGKMTQTADKALYRTDARQYANAQELIAAIVAEIAVAVGKTINVVIQKVKITIVGDQQAALNHIAANKEVWGES